MLQLIIFDYDGLMVDSEELAYRAERELLASFGARLERAYFNQFLGVPVLETLRNYLKKFPLKNATIENLVLERERLMLKREAELQPMKGLFGLLDCLHRKNIRLAIASSGTKEYVLRGLRHLGIENKFQVVVCSDEVKRGKPFPDLVLLALERAQIQAKNAIMLEDSLSGVEAAKRAGVFCIAVPPAGTDWNTYRHCDLVTSSLEQIRCLLLTRA